MDAESDFLLNAWREAGRHVLLTESGPALARLISSAVVPLVGLHVVELDRRGGEALVRVSAGPEGAPGGALARGAAWSLDRRAWDQWISAGMTHFLRAGEAPRGRFAALSPPRVAAQWVAVPLGGEGRPAGALLLQIPEDERVGPDALVRLGRLAEPVSAALEGDRRLRDLEALRSAAEEDRRAALRRMGREDFVDVIVGEDGGLAPVMERVGLVAPSDIPVLIFGETGSGKEVIARAIHNRSPRSGKPFVRVNCAAIPPELVDSELFGHERGAFTGATATRRGWFERADQGTLFLDEIGDLPLPAQVRLLRVVQEGVFERVGGEDPLRVSVRLVAATHADLPAMVQNRRFREDLWYRIAGFQIILPPLRERREDIPGLARHFLGRAARRFGLRALDLAPDDVALLAAYDWPGNVRELASVMDRAAILGAGRSLEVATALGAGSALRPRPAPGPARAPAAPAGEGFPSLEETVRGHIEAALAATGGRIEGVRGAAGLLGVNPHTLRSRMRKLGIDWSAYRR